ncbi:MAG: undecaprenyl-diphosphatase UppP [Deltaproteobacteria bacterium]|nr:MAG: undecaprenyl-diphosphatase UppP [Deltaproteobacteria bacterium]
MALWFAALLGLVQGLTEFLPISSTAHLRIVPALLGQPDPGAAFSAVIQLGTLVAVVGYFARDLFVAMPRALLRDRGSHDARMAMYLVVGTVPIGIAGLALERHITGPLRSLYVVGGALVAVAIVMAYADRREGHRGIDAVGLADAVWVGCAQALALVPGVSRSGATIAAALVLGLRRTDAARFSFLLGVPAIFAAGVYELRHVAAADVGAAPIAVGIATAAVSGYASIAWLLRFLASHRFTPFVIYRIALGVTVISLAAMGAIAG